MLSQSTYSWLLVGSFLVGISVQADWQVVGKKGFSAGTAFETNLAIDNTGVPYVAYLDEANSQKATVMKYDGSS